MKLTAKLVAVFILCTIVLTAIHGYLTVVREVELYEDDMKLNARRMGTAMEEMVEDVWQLTGEGRTLDLIRQADGDQQRMRIRWVWLEDKQPAAYRPLVPLARLKNVAEGQEVSVRMREPSGEGFLVSYFPAPVSRERTGALELSQSLARLDAYRREIIWRTFFLMCGVVLVSGLLMGLLGVRVVGRPLKMLIDKTRRVGAGDLSGPLHMSRRDELAELAAALNTMCVDLDQSKHELMAETASRIQALDQLRHADRLRTVGRLASGVAHELGTPLNVVSGRAGLIASGKLSPDEVVASAQTIKTEADRIAQIVRHLLDFARRSVPQRVPVDLGQLARQTIELLEPLAEKRGSTLTLTTGPGSLTALVDAAQIQQVFSNLLVNALQSMPAGGPVDMRLEDQQNRAPDGTPGPFIRIDIADKGTGVAPENLERLFEPFFTTKPVGEGTGLGLSIAYGIVQDHDGWIGVASEVGEGSCFSVHLPQERTT